jgi:hypothetical protein
MHALHVPGCRTGNATVSRGCSPMGIAGRCRPQRRLSHSPKRARSARWAFNLALRLLTTRSWLAVGRSRPPLGAGAEEAPRGSATLASSGAPESSLCVPPLAPPRGPIRPASPTAKCEVYAPPLWRCRPMGRRSPPPGTGRSATTDVVSDSVTRTRSAPRPGDLAARAAADKRPKSSSALAGLPKRTSLALRVLQDRLANCLVREVRSMRIGSVRRGRRGIAPVN